MILMALVLPAGLQAGPTDVAGIRQQLEKIIPGEKPDSITESPISGLFEVLYGPEVFYVSKDGRYVLQGDLYDAGQQLVNLTEEKRTIGRRELIESLDEKSMIIFRSRKPKHTVTVFTDVDCAYCRKLHHQMADYNRAGITIRYLSFPRTGINTPSYFKAVSVWCADDRNAAITNAKNGAEPEPKDCINPVKEHMAVAAKIGVSGTPTLVLEDGTMLPGYVDPKRLAEILDHHDRENTAARF
jgi:thiol:disulfide interchange protein DsbC